MDVRPITDDEVPALRAALMLTFGGDPEQDPHGDARLRALIEPGRAFGAFDGATVVATAASFALRLAVPGGELPMAGLTMVTVRPTHRRRGLLRRLIALHLEDARRRGEPISGLWASEATIYGRFGYGVAALGDELSFRAEGLEVSVPGGPPDTVDLVEERAAAEAFPEVFARVAPARPGCYARTTDWWEHRRFRDRPDARKGASPRRFVIARRDGVATGTLVYRQKLAFAQASPDGAVVVEEMIAADPRAEASLWRFLAQVDLFPKVSWDNAPVDALLPWLVPDARRITRRSDDTLWLRPDDIPRVLAARRYPADGALRLAVEGATYLLTVEGGAALCEPTDAAPDLRLDRAALGAIYLGGVAPTTLARAGRIDGATALADRMFGWPVAPWCMEMF